MQMQRAAREVRAAVAGAPAARARLVAARAQKASKQKQVDYGPNWYEATRAAAVPARTVREEIARRREANRIANNGRERKDLYTDNWDGSEYKGSRFNILTLLAALFFLVPVAGLAFAYTTFGVLWG